MNWDRVKIEDVFLVTDFVANGSFASLRENVSYNYSPDYAILIRTTDNSKGWNGDFVYVSKSSFEFLKKSQLFPGDLIIANVGEPGKAFLCPDLKMPMTLGPNSILVRPLNNEVVDNRFFFYYTTSPWGQSQIEEISSATSQKKFNKTSYRSLEIPLPPLETQKKIAAILDAADAYRQKTKALIEKYDELAQSLFLEMFGDPVKNEKGWEFRSLESLVSKLGDGIHGTPEYSDEGDYFFINGNNLEKGSIILSNATKKVSENEYLKHRRDLNKNTMLVSINGTLGKVAFFNGENVMLGKSVCYFNYKPQDVNPQFLFYVIQSEYFLRYAQNQATGSTIKNVSLKSMRSLPIPYPPLKKQNEFAVLTKELESHRNSAIMVLEKSEELFNSLLQRAFNGTLFK